MTSQFSGESFMIPCILKRTITSISIIFLFPIFSNLNRYLTFDALSSVDNLLIVLPIFSFGDKPLKVSHHIKKDARIPVRELNKMLKKIHTQFIIKYFPRRPVPKQRINKIKKALEL